MRRASPRWPGAHGQARAAQDERTAAWLARHARIDPAGFVMLSAAALASGPLEICRRALQQVLISVGGTAYPPRQARLARLLEQIRVGLASGRTLAGCRVLPWRGGLLICREPRAIDAVAPLVAGAPLLWDGRFRLELAGDVPELVVRALAGARVHAGLGLRPRAACPRRCGPVCRRCGAARSFWRFPIWA